MDIGGIPSKIAANADKIGIVVGALSTLNGLQPGNPIGAATAILEGLVRKPHFPNLDNVVGYILTYDPSHTFKYGIGAAIAGWIASEIDMHPTVTKIGSALMKAGIGAAEANVALTFLIYSGLSSSPPDQSILSKYRSSGTSAFSGSYNPDQSYGRA